MLMNNMSSKLMIFMTGIRELLRYKRFYELLLRIIDQETASIHYRKIVYIPQYFNIFLGTEEYNCTIFLGGYN
jgi:hypothetical protein